MNISCKWFEEALEQIHHPVACLSLNGKFVWANGAWSSLLGYSISEILTMHWADVTVLEDVGGDSLSIDQMNLGEINQYRMFKRYRHKNGVIIPTTIIVKRFPYDPSEQLVFLTVEAILQGVTVKDISLLQTDLNKATDLMAQNRNTINIGNNDPKLLMLAIIVGLLIVGWGFYYVAGDGQAPPPKPNDVGVFQSDHSDETTEP